MAVLELGPEALEPSPGLHPPLHSKIASLFPQWNVVLTPALSSSLPGFGCHFQIYLQSARSDWGDRD